MGRNGNVRQIQVEVALLMPRPPLDSINLQVYRVLYTDPDSSEYTTGELLDPGTALRTIDEFIDPQLDKCHVIVGEVNDGKET